MLSPTDKIFNHHWNFDLKTRQRAFSNQCALTGLEYGNAAHYFPTVLARIAQVFGETFTCYVTKPDVLLLAKAVLVSKYAKGMR